jgi:hypothetical protein
MRVSRWWARILGGAALTVASVMPAVAPAAPAGAITTPQVKITEVAPWASGNAPYAADWWELTNAEASPVTISGWKMDDNSNSFGLSVALNGVTTLAAGESAIFIEGSAATATAFKTAWWGASPPSGLQVGFYSGSGVGLSSGGDAVNVFDGSGNLVWNVSFGVSDSTSPFQSFDNTAGLSGTISTLSQVGTNGAFTAPDGIEVGSPGAATTGVVTTTTAGGPTTTAAATTTTTTPGSPAFQTWPGSPTVQNASTYVFNTNLSGLDYEGTGSSTPGVMWGVRNGPGTLFRLQFDGTNWNPDPANGWANGKALHYPNGSGDPDSEGVTFVGDTSAGGMYVSTERDNSNNGTSKLSVLRYDTSGTATSLNATNEWNLTSDIPPTGANLGLEGITWIDDSYLTSQNFFDNGQGHTYNPADYPDHGTGIFFVGVEGSGMIYAYALDQSGSTFHRVASFPSGFPAVMELRFDRDLKDLWAVCDNGCNGRTTVHRIDPATGKFGIALGFERPAGMPNYNNEGFAIAPATYCQDGQKPVYWADDTEDNGVSIRSGTLPCAALGGPGPVLAEFPIAGSGGLVALLIGGAWLLRRRRRSLPVAA